MSRLAPRSRHRLLAVGLLAPRAPLGHRDLLEPKEILGHQGRREGARGLSRQVTTVAPLVALVVLAVVELLLLQSVVSSM